MFSNILWKGFQIFLIALLPVIELRGAIPYGVFALKLHPLLTFLFAIAGNIFPVYFLLTFLDPVVQFFFKNRWIKTHLEKYFNKLHQKHSEHFHRVSFFTLAAFVAIPIPGTGAWTGALLAYLFNLPKKQSFLSISLGVLGAAIIVTFFTDGIQFIQTM